MSTSLRLIFGLSFNVFGALALDSPFCGATLKLGKYYYTIFLSSMMLFKGFKRSISIYRNLTELCTTPAWAVSLGHTCSATTSTGMKENSDIL